MKKLLFVFIISIPLLSGCGEGLRQLESDYILKVTGTPGINFNGGFTFPGASGSVKPAHVEGRVPAEYKGRGITAICVFRKADAKGILKVEIIKDKAVVDSSETSEPFGVITMGKAPNRDGILNLLIDGILDVLGI